MANLLLTVLDMSITASYVILAILVMRLLLKKAPKKYSYALWAVAGFRLVCPVSFQSVLSLFNLTLPKFETARQEVFEHARELVGYSADFEHARELVGSSADTGVVIYPIGTSIEVLDRYTATINGNIFGQVNPMVTVLKVITILCLIGMAAMIIISIINYLRLRHKLRFATRMEKNIWQCETVRSPFILGLFPSKIYLPYGLDCQTLEYILAHEKHHLKRLDHVIKLLSFAILTVHWFNPLCHLAFHLMNRDMEMSCDEYVLSKEGISSTDYSRTLLSIASNKRFPAPTPLAFGETGVAQRIKNILHWKKPALWVTIVALVLTIALLICCAADPAPAATSELFGKSYVTVETISEPALYNGSTHGKSFYFDIAKNGTFTWVQGDISKDLFKLEEFQLTEENFDVYLGQTSASELRKYNKTAWGWNNGASLCYVLQQQNDDIYLVGGNIESISPALSWIFVFRLQTKEEAPVIHTAPPPTTVLKTPFGMAYTGTPCYVSPLISTLPSDEGWTLGADRSLSRWDKDEWTVLGQLEPITLTEDNFDIYFPPANTYFNPIDMRRNNDQAWALHIDQNDSGFREAYFFLKQSTGAFILLGGPYQPGKESSSLFVGYQLYTNYPPLDGPAPTDPPESTAPPKTEVFNRGENEQALITQALLASRNETLKDGEYGTVSYAVEQQAIACGSSDDPDVPAGYSDYKRLVMYQRFVLENGGLKVTKTEVYPATVTVDNYIDGTYGIRSVTMVEKETHPGNYFLPLTQSCYANAVAHFDLDTEPIIEDLLNQICSSPAQYSYPAPYIEAHQEEYDTLLYYGQHTLTYCFRQFSTQGGAGLSGHIMALACQEISHLTEEAFVFDFINGQDWYAQFKAKALSLRSEGADMDLYPVSKLLLSILPDPIN